MPYLSGPILSYNIRYIVGFGLVEMAISTNPNPVIHVYRNLYENTGPDKVKLSLKRSFVRGVWHG